MAREKRGEVDVPKVKEKVFLGRELLHKDIKSGGSLKKRKWDGKGESSDPPNSQQ